MRIITATFLPLGLSATNAGAQWSHIGGGNYGVTFGFRTTAGLGCTKQIYAQQPCSSDGTTLTQWNGASFAQLSFTGVTSSVTASNQSSGPINFGTLHVRYGGVGAFTWPAMVAPGIGSIALGLQLEVLDGPGATTGGIHFQFLQVAPSLMRAFLGEAQSNYIGLAFPYPQPGHLNYDRVIFDQFNMPHIDQLVDADYQIHANSVSIVPEPSTYALVGLGLAMVGVAAGRRRSR